MNVVVGDATGQIKIVSLKVDGPITKMGTQEASRGGISCMSWAGRQNRESEVAVGLSKGSIEIWDILNQEKVAHMEGLNFGKKEDKYVGVHVLRHNDGGVEERGDVTRRLISATSYGLVSIAPWVPLLPDLDDDEDDLLAETMSAAQIKAYKKKRNDERMKLMQERDEQYMSGAVHFKCGRHLERTRLSPTHDILAAGGKDNKFRLYDIETQKPIYSTRNLPNNFLNLAVPNWDMDFAFFGQYTTTNPRPNSNGYMIATTTGYHQLRIYDTRDGSKRPTMYKTIGDHAARTVAVSNDENYVLVGDGAGKIQKFDIRSKLLPLGSMKGSCGSIRQIETHPSLPMIASVGYDRYLRVHDIETRKILKEVYLTQKLSDCLFSAVVPGEKAKSFIGKKITIDQTSATKKETPAHMMGQDEEDELWERLGDMNADSTTKDEDDIDDDEDDFDFDAIEHFNGEGEDDDGMQFEGEGFDFDQFEGEDFDPSMFGMGEEGDDFDFFDGEGEEGDFDEDEDDDEDFEDNYTCGFVILGPDGKPITSNKNVAPKLVDEPTTTKKFTKTITQNKNTTLTSSKPLTEPVKRKGITPQPDPIKKQRK